METKEGMEPETEMENETDMETGNGPSECACDHEKDDNKLLSFGQIIQEISNWHKYTLYTQVGP